MLIVITRKHMRMGQPKLDSCPLSLACQEALDLPKECIRVSPLVLSLYDFNRRLCYTCKWPPEAEKFYKKYYDHFKYGSKIPYTCKFEMGIVEFFPGYTFDTLKFVAFEINNVHGDESYEE